MTMSARNTQWQGHYAAGKQHPRNVSATLGLPLGMRPRNRHPLDCCWARGYADARTGAGDGSGPHK